MRALTTVILPFQFFIHSHEELERQNDRCQSSHGPQESTEEQDVGGSDSPFGELQKPEAWLGSKPMLVRIRHTSPESLVFSKRLFLPPNTLCACPAGAGGAAPTTPGTGAAPTTPACACTPKGATKGVFLNLPILKPSEQLYGHTPPDTMAFHCWVFSTITGFTLRQMYSQEGM